MSRQLVIDPVSRIGGHLRIEAQLAGGHTIAEAYSSGTMVRAIETIMKGRDPREVWAFAGRICGICTTVHSVASVRAVEDAVGAHVPRAASLMRNLMLGQQCIRDHVMHFYILAGQDWLDLASALDADPEATSRLQQSISPWPNASAAYFRSVQDRLRTNLACGEITIFTNPYQGHPAYALPPELDLLGAAHYLEALDWQAQIVRIQTILGGKDPHPNFLVGGMPMPIDLNSDQALNAERLGVIDEAISRIAAFVDQVYLPDLLVIAPYYREYASIGRGPGNYLTWGEYPTGDIRDTGSYLVPPGIVLNADLGAVHAPEPRASDRLEEFITHAWYEHAACDCPAHPPWQGETVLHYTGPTPPYEQLQVEGKYSWIKAPRYDGAAMEVGPLARVLVMYATGHPLTRALVDATLEALGLPVAALHSTLGRTAARAIESQVIADAMRTFYDDLVAEIRVGHTDTFDARAFDRATWPAHAEGFGFVGAPRGALGHWVVIDHGQVANYQVVAPSTWNASPRDEQGHPGPYETSLAGLTLARPDQPLEVLRVIHSFDPCLACAVHLVDARRREVAKLATGLNVSFG